MVPLDKKVRFNILTSDLKPEVSLFSGIKKLWSGFGAYYARTGPRTLVTLLIMDTLLYNYKLMKFKKQNSKSENDI